MYVTSTVNERGNLWVSLETDSSTFKTSPLSALYAVCTSVCACICVNGRVQVPPATLITAKAGASRPVC